MTININNKKINLALKNIEDYGYASFKKVIPQKLINYLLKKTQELYKKQKKNNKIPKVWNSADIVFNLQNKDKKFIELLTQPLFEKILIKKINDPHFRNLPKNIPNYILNNFIARSSNKGKLFLHIDSGIPTGDVTTFIQFMIPLQSTNKKTGCTIVVPKSHKSKKFTDRNISSSRFKYLEGEPGDIFVWDGNLWHGSLPNQTEGTRWCLIATFSNWQFKQVFDITRGLKNSIFNKLSLKEKILLGYLGIPSHDENVRVTRSINPSMIIKKNRVNDIYKI